MSRQIVRMEGCEAQSTSERREEVLLKVGLNDEKQKQQEHAVDSPSSAVSRENGKDVHFHTDSDNDGHIVKLTRDSDGTAKLITLEEGVQLNDVREMVTGAFAGSTHSKTKQQYEMMCKDDDGDMLELDSQELFEELFQAFVHSGGSTWEVNVVEVMERHTFGDDLSDSDSNDSDESDGEEGAVCSVKLVRRATGRAVRVRIPEHARLIEVREAALKKFRELRSGGIEFRILAKDEESGGEVKLGSQKVFKKYLNSFKESSASVWRLIVTENHPAPQLEVRRSFFDPERSEVNGLATAQQQSRRTSLPSSSHRVDVSSPSDDDGYNCSATAPIEVTDEELRDFTRLRLLGKGSFGPVYEGLTDSGTVLAMKVMEVPPDRVYSSDAEASELQVIQDEVKLMKKLRDPSIVRYFGSHVARKDSGKMEFQIFQERCSGSLENLLSVFGTGERRRLTVQRARAVTRHVLQGLRYLHSKNVCHRNIKASNVLFSSTGENRAKLADFGSSFQLESTHDFFRKHQVAEEEKNGVPQGVLFMAPEVLAEETYSLPADIWSVGCLVIEMFGKKPWIWPDANPFHCMRNLAEAKSLPNGVPDQSCPPALRQFFERCFDRDANSRATAEELLGLEWLSCPDSELEEPQWCADSVKTLSLSLSGSRSETLRPSVSKVGHF